MCQRMLLIHKANLWPQGNNWYLMAFRSTRQTFLFFFYYTFILQMYFVMPMKMEVGERNYDLIFHKNDF